MLINSFRARVLGDAGTFEGEANLLNQKLVDVNAASFVFVPSGYKTSKLYSFKGSDLTFARGSVASRNNSSNAMEQIAANVGRVSYVNGLPTLPIEPIRTNILPFSNDFTGYVKININPSGNIITENTASGQHTLETPWFSGHTINTLHTFSLLVRQNTGTRNVTISVSNGVDGDIISQVLNLQTGVLSESILIGTASWTNVTNRVTLQSNGDYLFEISGQSSVGNSRKMRANMINGSISNYLGNGTSSIRVAHFQSEVGGFASSRILTTGSAVTRVADNLQTQNLGNLTNYTIFFDQIITFDTGSSSIQHVFNNTLGLHFYSVTTNIGIRFYNQTNSQHMFGANSGAINKWVITFNGSIYTLFVNGVKITTYTPPNIVNHVLSSFNTQISSGFLGFRDSALNIKSVYIFPKVLSDMECVALTT
jgi:hypothetical protein